MFSKISEIAKAWLISRNPSPIQTELAKKRYDICVGCKYYNKSRPITGEEYCTECLCPITKKIFSEKFDACPKHYWLEVEKPYYKTEKTVL
jgi:hypothetical protein